MQKKETQNCTYVFLKYELTYNKKRNPKSDLLVGDTTASTASWNRSPCQIEIWSFMIVYPTATWEGLQDNFKDYQQG